MEGYCSSLGAARAAGRCMGTVGSLHSLSVSLKLSLSKMVYRYAHVHIHAKHVREKEVSNNSYIRTQFLKKKKTTPICHLCMCVDSHIRLLSLGVVALPVI